MTYKVITKKDYPKFFIVLEKILKKSNIETPRMKLEKDDKHFNVKSSMIPFSNSITYTSRAWKIFNDKERIAVALHEIGHINSKFRILIYLSFFILFLLTSIISFYFSLSVFFTILLFLVFLRFPFMAIISYISQVYEFKADKFSKEKYNKKYLKSAIKKTLNEKFHPNLRIIYLLLVKPFCIHPSIKERIYKLDLDC